MSGQCHAIEFRSDDTATDTVRILDSNVVTGGAVSE